jgi:phage terminase large subunit-like protein
MCEPIRLTIYPKQVDFLQSAALIRGYAGGRGAGKSWTGAHDLLNRAKPGRLYFIGAPTYPMLRDAAWRMFIDKAKERKLLAEETESPTPWAKLHNGAEIIGRSADNPDRFRGPNLSGVWLDEASQMEHEAFLLVFACLREGGEQGWLTGTFTPRGKAHWTYKVFTGPGARLITAKSYDNPFMPESLVGALRDAYSEQFASQELNAEFLEDFGSQIKGEWIRYYRMQGDILQLLDPAGGQASIIDQRQLTRFATVDTAGSSKDKAEEAKGKVNTENNTASWSVCAVWDYWRAKDLLLLRYVWRDRVSYPQLKAGVTRTLEQWGVKKTVIENATMGAALAAELKMTFGTKLIPTVLPGMNEGIGQRGAKLERAITTGLIKRAESGKLVIPHWIPDPKNPTWMDRYFREITEWTGEPNEAADQVDVSSYASWETRNTASRWGGQIKL